MYLKFIRVVKYNKNGIWMFIRLKSLMKESFQVVFGKSDSKKSQIVIKRETRKETGLELSQMQYLITNKNYDYDIYICDIKRFKPRHMESLKANP